MNLRSATVGIGILAAVLAGPDLVRPTVARGGPVAATAATQATQVLTVRASADTYVSQASSGSNFAPSLAGSRAPLLLRSSDDLHTVGVGGRPRSSSPEATGAP